MELTIFTEKIEGGIIILTTYVDEIIMIGSDEVGIWATKD